MPNARDSLAFAAKPLLDIDAVVDAYVEADHVREVAKRLGAQCDMLAEFTGTEQQVARLHKVLVLLDQWADAREASVAKMLEG